MRAITPERYDQALAASGLKKKFISELRPKFADVDDWGQREFLAITDRSGNNGILWVDVSDAIYILPFTLSRGIIDKATGRARSVICDLCYTQHAGTAAGRLTITMPGRTGESRSVLCCGDLACSAHVRGLTTASLKSKAQLRETITADEKVQRLQRRLGELVQSLGAPLVA